MRSPDGTMSPNIFSLLSTYTAQYIVGTTVCDFYNNEKSMKTVKATSVLKPCVYFVVIFDQFVPIS